MSAGAPQRLDASRLVALAGAPPVVVGLAFPLALVALAVAAGRLPPEQAASAWSVRIWTVALGAATAAGIATSLRERRPERVLGLLAAAAAALQLLAGWALRFDGTVSAGVAEAQAPWETRRAGALARAPAIEVLELPAAPGAPARLRVDGDEVSAPLGRAVRARRGTWITVSGPFPAPSFEVHGPGGARVEAGLVKVDPGSRAWFMPGFLPHRLYLTAAAGGTGADPRSPERLHLRVQRGKLRVLDRDLAAGELVSFERLSFSFGPGEVWARVEVRRRAVLWPGLALAAGLGGAALAVALARRRRAC